MIMRIICNGYLVFEEDITTEEYQEIKKRSIKDCIKHYTNSNGEEIIIDDDHTKTIFQAGNLEKYYPAWIE